MRIIIEKRHTIGAEYTDCTNCAAAKAFKEQHPSIKLFSMCWKTYRVLDKRGVVIALYGDNVFWSSTFRALQDGEIDKFIVNIPYPEYDNQQEPLYKDITSSLAVLPIEETSDCEIKIEALNKNNTNE